MYDENKLSYEADNDMNEPEGDYFGRPDFDGRLPMHGGPDFGGRPPMHDGPDFDGRPPMHGGPDFDGRPPMHGGPDFDGRPPMHGGPDFGGRTPMHGGPNFGGRLPMHGRDDFGGRRPMHGGPDFGRRTPMHDRDDFGGRLPMHGGPEDPMADEPLIDLPGQYDAMSTEEKLMHDLRRLSHRIHIAREGISGQKRILTILSAVPCISQRQLTELLGVRAGTLSEVVGKLEAAGKIRRMPNPTDRRTWMISITEAGLETVRSQVPDTNMNMFALLSEEEKNTLLTILEKLLKEGTGISQKDSGFHKI